MSTKGEVLWILSFIEFAFGSVGYVLLGDAFGWGVPIAVFLLTWAHYLNQSRRRIKAEQGLPGP